MNETKSDLSILLQEEVGSLRNIGEFEEITPGISS